MAQFFYNILLPLSCSIMTLLVSYCLGFLALKKIKIFENISLLTVGISVLLGYGILAYATIAWTFFAPLKAIPIALLMILLLGLRRKDIALLYNKAKNAVIGWKNYSAADKTFLYIFLLLFVFYLTSACVPPYQTDSLAYHLPISRFIAQNGIIKLSQAGNYYANMPLLMESLYSLAYTISGYTLINLVHYQLLLAGLLVIYYFAREQFGKLSAQISIALIFTLYEVFTNATSADVDAATAAYQIASMILVLIWAKNKDNNLLAGAGLLYGLALSIKYLSLYALLLILPFIVYISFTNSRSVKNTIKDIYYFCIPVFLFSGFWYIKNWMLFGNPFYPFIFAHPGFTKEQIEMASTAIKEFRPRTLKNFLLFPFILFKDKYYITSLLAFLSLPLGFFWVAKDRIFRYILIFVFSYFTIWFFFISHQKRFAIISIFFLMICCGYVLSKIYYRYQRFFDNKITRALLIIIVFVGVGIIFTAKNGYFFKVKRAELAYDAGIADKGQFYKDRGMGDIYYLSEFINKNYNSTNFLQLWSEDTGSFLDDSNTFVSLHNYINGRTSFDVETFKRYLKDSDISFVVDFNQSAQDKIMKEWYNSDDPAANDYRDKVIVKVIEISDFMPKIGKLVYNDHERLIYAVKQ